MPRQPGGGMPIAPKAALNSGFGPSTAVGARCRGPGLGPVLAFLAWGLAVVVHPAAAQDIASDWIEGERNRIRMTAGYVEGAAPGTVMAFIELAMDKGWKTYWRNPGTAGGIPPEFDWSQSQNVAKAEVLFPIPKVMSDKAGDVIGYREFAVFPVRIWPQDPSAALALDVTVSYGICETLCVPAEARLTLAVPPGPLPPAGPDAAAAFKAVPRVAPDLSPGDPVDLRVEQHLSGPAPVIRLSARFPGDAAEARMFIDVADGRYVPLPVKRDAEGERVTFEIDLAKPEDLAAVRGASIRVTLAGSKGQSEDGFVVD